MDSAYARAVGEGRSEWRIGEQLLASIEYLLQAQIWQAGGGRGERPRPRVMPWDEPRVHRTGLSDAEIERRLLQQRLRTSGGGDRR